MRVARRRFIQPTLIIAAAIAIAAALAAFPAVRSLPAVGPVRHIVDERPQMAPDAADSLPAIPREELVPAAPTVGEPRPLVQPTRPEVIPESSSGATAPGATNESAGAPSGAAQPNAPPPAPGQHMEPALDEAPPPATETTSGPPKQSFTE